MSGMQGCLNTGWWLVPGKGALHSPRSPALWARFDTSNPGIGCVLSATHSAAVTASVSEEWNAYDTVEKHQSDECSQSLTCGWGRHAVV